MIWTGPKLKPNKYTESTFNGIPIAEVQLEKSALFDEDGFLDAKEWIHLYDANGTRIKSDLRPIYELGPYALADYMLCSIQDEKGLDVQK